MRAKWTQDLIEVYKHQTIAYSGAAEEEDRIEISHLGAESLSVLPEDQN